MGWTYLSVIGISSVSQSHYVNVELTKLFPYNLIFGEASLEMFKYLARLNVN